MQKQPPSSEPGSLSVVSQDDVIQFVRVCGLRKTILARLRVGDIQQDDGWVWIDVNDSDGVSLYQVPVLSGSEPIVLLIIEDRQPEELVFPSLPQPLYLQPARIHYACALYQEICSGNLLDYDEESIVRDVMQALCESDRIEVVRRYYLGLSPRKRDVKKA